MASIDKVSLSFESLPTLGPYQTVADLAGLRTQLPRMLSPAITTSVIDTAVLLNAIEILNELVSDGICG
jgi:hypothetical protein